MSDLYVKDIQPVFQSVLAWSEGKNQLEMQDISLAVAQLTNVKDPAGKLLATLACDHIPEVRKLIEKYWEIQNMKFDNQYSEIIRCVRHSLSMTLTKETSRINATLMTAWSQNGNLAPLEEMKVALTKANESLKSILTTALTSFDEIKGELDALKANTETQY